MEAFLSLTAWPIGPSGPGSAFHAAAVLILLPAALAAAWKLRGLSETRAVFLLFLLGIFLAASEVYKQLFLYYIENGRHYNWWYFPFQLCSLPMYLCLLLPVLSPKARKIVFTFMYQYNLLGALLVFAEPSGLFHPYLALTLHGFLWHGILVFIGFWILFSGRADTCRRQFLTSTALFLICCAAATGINVLARFAASPPWQDADMFYISPFYQNTQIVFHQIAECLGIFPGNAVYIGAVVAGAAVMRRISRQFKPAL